MHAFHETFGGFGVVSPDRRACRGSQRDAYTLIELLIVIAILGISASLLIPHLVGRDIFKAESAVRLLIGDLSFAQSDAMAHQEYRRIHFYSDGTGYCLTRITQAELNQPFDPDSADYLTDPISAAGQMGRYVVNFNKDDRFHGLSLSSIAIDGTGTDLQFDSLGGTIAPGGGPGIGGTLVLSSGNESYRISIAPFTGKLTVVKL